jgi:hypothetical protein
MPEPRLTEEDIPKAVLARITKGVVRIFCCGFNFNLGSYLKEF